VALALSKKLGKSPREAAEEIAVKIGKQKFLEKVEVAGPGFINFYLSKDFFVDQLKKIDKKVGHGKHAKGWKVFIEHTQPNPFKVFHIGHLMNNAIGESVARIIKANGATVKTASYHGDVGLHVAKAVWALKKGIVLQKAYAAGHKAYEENETSKEEILEINKKIYEKSDKVINVLFEKGRKESLHQFEKAYRLLDNKFDYRFYESDAGKVGKDLVLKNVGAIFSQGEQGAIVFEGEKFEPKTHTRVFINSEGFPTYEGKEVGLAQIKKSKFNYDASITVTGNEQNSFFNVVEVAIGEVFPNLKGKLQHLSHGMLKLPSGKMSSRTGTVISAEDLINQVKEKVQEKAKDRNLSEATVEQIAIGALKYSILKQSIGSDIIFDFEKSVSFEGDSGPYLQYSYVRANSVLAKAKKEGVKASLKNVPAELGSLEKMIIQFPEIVQKAGRDYQPHVVALYLTELAHEFNTYYAHHKIAQKGGEFGVAVTQAFCYVMKNGLDLLGIRAPEKM
jgi:arginyl-tRNA synthetase